MSHYTRLSQKERLRIFQCLDSGHSIRTIAERLNRHRSTIYRELQRNHSDGRYLPGIAQQKSQARHEAKGRSCKISQSQALYHYVLRHLRDGWSPEQISGRMKRDNKPYDVCHETIYQYIYRNATSNWYAYLAKAKPKRGTRYKRTHRCPGYRYSRTIYHRPEEVYQRNTLGHWEGDSMVFHKKTKHNITTLVERTTRYMVLTKNESFHSTGVMGRIADVIKEFPKKVFKSITFDCGIEFSNVWAVERASSCKTYFCDPRSPWQRGTNENTNGRLRRYLPRGIPIEQLPQALLDILAKKLNNLPRKCLGYLTPKEAFYRYLKMPCRNNS